MLGRVVVTYDACDEEWPLEGVVDLGVFHGFLLLHLVDQVGRVVSLHVEQHQPEVDADAGHQGAEVAAAQLEVLFSSESHFIN